MRSRNVWRVLLMVGALALLAATVPISGAGANGAPAMSEGQSFTLFAGQDIPVGDVSVMNDTDGNLYVTFSTESSSWCMTETHLAIEDDPEEIPQTKKHNPIPGQFEYSGDHDCVKTVPYKIPVGGDFAVGETFFVGAHAVVWDMNSLTIGEFFSDGDGKTMVTAGNVPDAIYPLPAVDAWEAFNDPPDTEDSTWDSLVSRDFVYGADWIWESYRVVNWTVPQSVVFEHSFDIPGYPTGGVVRIAADNMYSASMNGDFLGEQTNYNNWPLAGGYNFIPMMGENTLEIVGTNYGNSSYTEYSNPAGLIFEGCYKYYAHEETAWSEGTEFADDRGWATYSTYTVDRVLVDSFDVDSSDTSGATSTFLLENGVGYDVDVSGTWMNGSTRAVDAEFISDDNWVTADDGPSWDTTGNQLDLRGAGWIAWGEYDPGHEYTASVAGDGTAITLLVFDGDPITETINSGWYNDNVGSLSVEIWWVG